MAREPRSDIGSMLNYKTRSSKPIWGRVVIKKGMVAIAFTYAELRLELARSVAGISPRTWKSGRP